MKKIFMLSTVLAMLTGEVLFSVYHNNGCIAKLTAATLRAMPC